MYVRFPLSLRNVEDLLLERGIDLCHETVRLSWNRLGPTCARDIRRQRASLMRGSRHWRSAVRQLEIDRLRAIPENCIETQVHKTVMAGCGFAFGLGLSVFANAAAGLLSAAPIAIAQGKMSEMRWRSRCAVSMAPRFSTAASTSS
ncbi:MAG: family transposase, partial [Sphingomonas bacterium]|nr:family transposase [Sphingomonas bacterium]